jgi:hypothetical protein
MARDEDRRVRHFSSVVSVFVLCPCIIYFPLMDGLAMDGWRVLNFLCSTSVLGIVIIPSGISDRLLVPGEAVQRVITAAVGIVLLWE